MPLWRSAAAVALLACLSSPFLHQLPLLKECDLAMAGALDSLDKWPSVMPGSLLRNLSNWPFNPEGYHGPNTWTTSGSSSAGFFEGWYYKLTSSAGETLIVIPGVIFRPNIPDGGFCFVMVGDPSHPEAPGRYQLHRFPLSQFSTTAAGRGGAGWEVRIGANRFRADSLHLSIQAAEQAASGYVEAVSSQPWPTSLVLPDVMGWFAWLPGMECRHGVVSLYSKLKGSLELNGRPFVATSAYIEKDWGSAFPRTYTWIQASFDETATLLLSVASIPFPSDRLELTRFRGFLGGLWLPQHGGLYRFATYTGAVVESLSVSPDENRVRVVIRSAQHALTVTAEGRREEALRLHGPTPGGHFEPWVDEMLGARVQVELVRRSDGQMVFSGESEQGGLEIESSEAGTRAGGIRLLETGSG
jgi:tocopherol cyclase